MRYLVVKVNLEIILSILIEVGLLRCTGVPLFERIHCIQKKKKIPGIVLTSPLVGTRDYGMI